MEAVQDLPEVEALQELHDEKVRTVHLREAIDLDHIGVVEVATDARFSREVSHQLLIPLAILAIKRGLKIECPALQGDEFFLLEEVIFNQNFAAE